LVGWYTIGDSLVSVGGVNDQGFGKAGSRKQNKTKRSNNLIKKPLKSTKKFFKN